jgi:hypothetical protein
MIHKEALLRFLCIRDYAHAGAGISPIIILDPPKRVEANAIEGL